MEIEELRKINAGGITKLAIVGGVIVFLLGILDGFINPTKCNN